MKDNKEQQNEYYFKSMKNIIENMNNLLNDDIDCENYFYVIEMMKEYVYKMSKVFDEVKENYDILNRFCNIIKMQRNEFRQILEEVKRKIKNKEFKNIEDLEKYFKMLDGEYVEK